VVTFWPLLVLHRLSELPSRWEEVLGVALDVQQLPPSAYVWATWTPKQQQRRLQVLKDRWAHTFVAWSEQTQSHFR
jgi:hypothetical protein